MCEFDQRPTLPPGCPEVFVKLVNACWNPDPDLRYICVNVDAPNVIGVAYLARMNEQCRPSSDEVLSILDTVAEDYERSPETWENTRLRKAPGS